MPTDPVGFIIASHEGPSWDMEVGRPAVFKLLSDQTGGRIAVFEEVVPPGMGTPLHIHHTSDEVIHIFSGRFAVRLGETTQIASSGAWIFIPRGSAHGWRNSGAEDGRMVYIFTPAAGACAFEDMRHEGIPLPDISPAVRDPIFARHGFELVSLEWE
jgi:quercetin dioxygenase-like cupin family protein